MEESTDNIIEENAGDRINDIMKKMKICTYVTIAAIILIVVCVAAEAVVGTVVGNRDSARKIITVLSYICNALPFVVMLPLFIRVNLKSKLAIEMRKKEGN